MKETIQPGEENQVLQWHSLLITLLCGTLLSGALPHNLGSSAGFPEQHPAPRSPHQQQPRLPDKGSATQAPATATSSLTNHDGN